MTITQYETDGWIEAKGQDPALKRGASPAT